MNEIPVNAGENKSNHGHFVKGDPRINRKGRPRTFDAVRKLAIKIAGEQADEEEVSRVVVMLRNMARSDNPSDRALFLAYAYGKPKDEVDVTTGGEKINKIVIEYADNDNAPETTPGATPGEAGAEAV